MPDPGADSVEPDPEELAEWAADYGVDPKDIRVTMFPDGSVEVIVCTMPYGGGMWNSGGC